MNLFSAIKKQQEEAQKISENKSWWKNVRRTSFGGLKVNQFNWERTFENNNVNEKFLTVNKTVFNIFSNFIPHQLIVCDDKDPPWFNTKIK